MNRELQIESSRRRLQVLRWMEQETRIARVLQALDRCDARDAEKK